MKRDLDSGRRNRLSWSWPTAISLGLVLCLPTTGTAQLDSATAKNPLHELAFLEGFWAGEIEGTIGSATGQRQYRFIIRDRFLLMMHDRDPHEFATEDDAHEEWSIFSFDSAREMIVLREFLVEGFVNTYTCQLDAGRTGLTCESEAVEGSVGLSMRLRYEFADPDHFAETFEVFGADGAVQVQMKGRWSRTGDSA